MLKIISGTLVVVTLLASPAQAEPEVTRRCGKDLTWKGVKCSWNAIKARAHEIDAAEYDTRAKHAEVDGDTVEADEMRRRAAFERGQAEAIRKLYPLPE